MVGLLSKPWLGYLSLKHQTFGLMELQRLVYQYHAEDEADHDPLMTYWLLLTYEGEVLEALEAARAEVKSRSRTSSSSSSSGTNNEAALKAPPDDNQLNNNPPSQLTDDQLVLQNQKDIIDAEKKAFLGISAALRNRENGAKHNTRLKVGLHIFGLAIVSLLMVGIAASNTMSLMGYLDSVGVSLGGYRTLFMGCTYICALWAQWMIFRKSVPKMMKAIFSFSRGWFKSDYLDAREIELASTDKETYTLGFKKTKDEVLKPLPGDAGRFARLIGYTLCTAAVSIAWGVLVYSKISTGFSSEDGFLNKSEDTANAWGLLFGVGSGICAFVLWSTTLRSELKQEERIERAGGVVAKKERSPVAILMILVTLYGLLGSVLGQSKVVFDELDWNNGHENPLNPNHLVVFAAFLIYATVSYMGRVKFNTDAMDNLCSLATTTLEKNTAEKRAAEWKEYGSRYMVGGGLIAALLTVAIVSTFYDQMQDPLANGTNGHQFVTPLGVAGLGALMLWSAFLVYDRQRHGADNADAVENDKVSKTALFSKSEIRKGYEHRTGQQVFAALVNALAFGAIGGSGIKFGAEAAGFNEHVVTVLSWLAMVALASQSFSTVNYQMRLSSKEGSPSGCSPNKNN